jgi:hypothetical protein
VWASTSSYGRATAVLSSAIGVAGAAARLGVAACAEGATLAATRAIEDTASATPPRRCERGLRATNTAYPLI